MEYKINFLYSIFFYFIVYIANNCGNLFSVEAAYLNAILIYLQLLSKTQLPVVILVPVF